MLLINRIRMIAFLAALLSWLKPAAQTASGDNYNFYTAGSFNPALQFQKFSNILGNLPQAIAMNQVNSIDNTHDGLVVAFHFSNFSCYNNANPVDYRVLKLFELTYSNTPFLEGYLKGGTLEFKRYYDFPVNSKYYSYQLYDSLFGLNETSNQGQATVKEMDYTVYLYLSDYFIWVEAQNPQNASTPACNIIKYAHSPVFWGPNLPLAPCISAEMNQIVKTFLDKDPKCKVVNTAPFVSGSENYSIKIASFKLDYLLSNIKSNVSNPATAPPLAGKQAQQTGALPITAAPAVPAKSTINGNESPGNREHAIAGIFEVAPNPANSSNITIMSSLTAAGMVQIIITDAAGTVMEQLEYFATSGRMNKQITLSPVIPNGMYFVKINTGRNTDVKKLLITR